MYDDDDGDALVSLVPRADWWWLVFRPAGVALYFYRTTFWFYREDFVYILGALFLWQLNKFSMRIINYRDDLPRWLKLIYP